MTKYVVSFLNGYFGVYSKGVKLPSNDSKTWVKEVKSKYRKSHSIML